MDAKLETIKDEMDKETGDGRDIDKARELADEFVAENPSLFVEFQDLSVHDCCKAADAFRAAGMEESLWLVETWCLHHFESQNIGGPANALVRLVPNNK